jgi:hypothetical protein
MLIEITMISRPDGTVMHVLQLRRTPGRSRMFSAD